MTERRFHEVANIFPLMTPAELDALAADIKENGQRHPVIVHPDDGSIIDGRNRFLACRKLGMVPHTAPWSGKGSLVALVLSLNLQRRHLDESQRAMVAAKVATLHKGQRPDRSIDPSPTQAQAAALLSVSVPSVKRARQVVERGVPELSAAVEAGRVPVSAAAELAALPPDAQREVVRQLDPKVVRQVAKETRAARYEERRVERVDNQAKAAAASRLDGSIGRFPIILADPAWRYDEGTIDPGRAIEAHYGTAELGAIKALPVRDVALDDCVLFLWAVAPLLPEAIEVMRAWGFEYRTNATWDKELIGTGYWFRGQHEHLLLGVRGNPPKPAREDCASSLIRERRSDEHSEKPVAVYELIDRYYPELPKLELFARGKARDGWSVWGAEAAA